MAKKQTDPITERQLLEQINGKLGLVVALLSISGKDPEQQINLLRSLGHDWKTIGDLVGLNPDTARLRAGKKTAKKKKRSSGGTAPAENS